LEPSSSSLGFGRRLLVLADFGALVGLVLGLGLYVMPFWVEGRLRWAFWLTLVSTVLHVFTSRGRSRGRSSGGVPPGGGRSDNP
jgi:hypothetical protein